MKLIDLVRKAEQQLLNAGVVFGHGTDNAWDEAAWITLWTLGLPLDTDLSPESEAAAQVVAAAGVEQVEQHRVVDAHGIDEEGSGTLAPDLDQVGTVGVADAHGALRVH